MKKALMLLLLGVMALGTGMANAAVYMGDATSARLQALGADANVVEDYDLIFTFPNKALDYKNTVDFRMSNLAGGQEADWGGFLNGKFSAIGVFGVYMHRPGSTVSNGMDWSTVNYMNDALYSLWDYSSTHGFATAVRHHMDAPNPLFDLFWGKNIANIDFGVKINYADTRDNYKDNEQYPSDTLAYSESWAGKDYSREFGIQVGAGLKNLGPFQEVNVAAGYSKGTWEDSYVYSYSGASTYVGENVTYKDDGIHAINLNVNLRHDIDEANDLKVFASAKFNNFGVKGTDWRYNPIADQYKAKTKATDLNLGVGVNHKVNEGQGLVSAGVRGNIQKYTMTAGASHNGVDIAQDMINDYQLTKEEIAVLDIPAFVSVEAKVKSWLTLRAGASYYLYSKVHTTDTYGHETYETFSNNSFYSDYEDDMLPMLNTGSIQFTTGFGLNWKNWVLDGVLNTDALQSNASDLQPGRGIFYDGGNMLTVVKADLKYKF